MPGAEQDPFSWNPFPWDWGGTPVLRVLLSRIERGPEFRGHWLFNGYNRGLRPATRLVVGQSLKLGLPTVNKSIGRKMLRALPAD